MLEERRPPLSNSKARDITYIKVGAATIVVTGTVVTVVVGVVVAALGATVVLVVIGFDAAVVGPKMTCQVTLLAIGVGASGSLPTLYIARLNCRVISNFA